VEPVAHLGLSGDAQDMEEYRPGDLQSWEGFVNGPFDPVRPSLADVTGRVPTPDEGPALTDYLRPQLELGLV
jgi:hypothetical protein